MKTFFKLIALEAGFLKKTLIIISVILTAFTAALLAILSVMLDMPHGMYEAMDNWKSGYYDSYGGESFAISLDGVSFSEATKYRADGYFAVKDGLTRKTELTANGNIFMTDTVTMLGKVEYRIERYGYVLERGSVNLLQRVATFDGNLQGDVMFLSDECANELGAAVGDTVQIDDMSFAVVAIYNLDALRLDYQFEDVVLPKGWFFVSFANDTLTYNNAYLMYHTVADIYTCFRSLNRKGVQCGVYDTLTNGFDNVALVQTFYGCLAALLGALVLFVMYVLFTLFYRERKAQICRLKLLGATDATVSLVYFTIAMFIVIVTVVVATALSVALSIHFMDICTVLFDAVYVYTFRLWLPLCTFGVFTLLSGAMFLLLGRKISRVPVAEEVRYE